VLALLLGLVWLPRAALATAPARRLLLVSIDGLSWPRLQRSIKHMPTLAQVAAAGVSGPLDSVFPSLTWPAHTSLATATFPVKHGVLGNRYWDRTLHKTLEYVGADEPLLAGVPTLWSIAKSLKLSTASILWPLTSGQRDLDWNLPEVMNQSDFERGSSTGLLAELRTAGLPVDQLGRVGKDEMFLADSFVRDAAVHLIRQHQPAVMLVHFLSVDALAHQFGPDSRAVEWALDLVDRYLGDVLLALEQAHVSAATDVLIVSDHGFHTIHTYADPAQILALAGVRNPGLGLAVNGQALFVYTRTPAEGGEVAARIRAKSDSLPEVASVLRGPALQVLGFPTPATHPRAPDLVVVARPDVFWVAGRGRGWHGPLRTLGMHGYPAGPSDGQAVLVAAGPHIRRAAQVPRDLRLVDAAALAAHLIGAAWPEPVDGLVPMVLVADPPQAAGPHGRPTAAPK